MSADARPLEDVRMHGFSQRAEVGAVVQWIDAHAHRLGATPIPLDPASGRGPEDIRAGAAVLEPGRSLRPQDLGLLASLGIAEIAVVAEPRVRIIVTGNEVVSPGTPKGEHQIYDANSAMLRGLVARDGGV